MEHREFELRFPTRSVKIRTNQFRHRGDLATEVARATKGSGPGVLSCEQVFPNGSRQRTWLNLALVEQVL